MSSTVWRKSMTDTTRGQSSSEESANRQPPYAADPFLALCEELESNLLASQQALVSGDLSWLEELTGKQLLFERKLANLLASAREAPPVTADSAEMQCKMRAAQLRILHLGRVHMALLARRQRSLRTLRHRMAGRESFYGPPTNPDTPMDRSRTREREA